MNKNQIKELRQNMGLSQAGFAEKAMTNQSTVCRWEAGIILPRGLALKHLRDLWAEAGLPALPSWEVAVKNRAVRAKRRKRVAA